MRAAYRSFDFAWVYVTTTDELMLIYPFVPHEEAVNNDPPTGQVHYKAADFDRLVRHPERCCAVTRPGARA